MINDERRKEKIADYLNDVEYTNDNFKEMNKLSVLLNNVARELADDKNEIKILTENNEALESRNSVLINQVANKDETIKKLKEENKALHELYNYWKDKFNNVISFFKKKLFRKEEERENTMDIVDEMFDKKVINQDCFLDLSDKYNLARETNKKYKEKEVDEDFEL